MNIDFFGKIAEISGEFGKIAEGTEIYTFIYIYIYIHVVFGKMCILQPPG